MLPDGRCHHVSHHRLIRHVACNPQHQRRQETWYATPSNSQTNQLLYLRFVLKFGEPTFGSELACHFPDFFFARFACSSPIVPLVTSVGAVSHISAAGATAASRVLTVVVRENSSCCSLGKGEAQAGGRGKERGPAPNSAEQEDGWRLGAQLKTLKKGRSMAPATTAAQPEGETLPLGSMERFTSLGV